MTVERCNALKSCTHVQESSPSMMHDKFRGPLDFPGQGASRATELIDFNRTLTKRNYVAAVRRNEANNNTQQPHHLFMWLQSLE